MRHIRPHATTSTFLAWTASLGILCLLSAARGDIDSAVQAGAAGLTVKTGDTTHNVAVEIGQLDALRQKILSAISEKTNANPPNYNIAEELKTLERVDNYSGKLADLVAANHPKARDVVSWLQANAAVAGAWREAYTSTEKFADNSRMAELKAIEKRMGRKFDGGIGGDIRGLRAIEDSASASAGMEELGRRVRLASGLIEKEPGLARFTFKVQPAVVEAGNAVTTVVGVALGGGGPDGTAGDAPKIKVLYELAVTGPKDFSVGNLKKVYPPGYSFDFSNYYTIPTTDLPPGNYTAALSATDEYGHSWTRVDIFEVKAPAATQPTTQPGGLVAGARAIGAALTGGFRTFATGSGLVAPAMQGETYVSFGGGDKDNERGYILIQPVETSGFTARSKAELDRSPAIQKIRVNGNEAWIMIDHVGSTQNSPSATLWWVNKGVYGLIHITLMNEKFSEKTARAVEDRVRDLADKLDKIITENAGK